MISGNFSHLQYDIALLSEHLGVGDCWRWDATVRALYLSMEVEKIYKTLVSLCHVKYGEQYLSPAKSTSKKNIG